MNAKTKYKMHFTIFLLRPSSQGDASTWGLLSPLALLRQFPNTAQIKEILQ